MEYASHVAALVCIYAILAAGLNLLFGAGIISLGHAAFFALGAYTTAILTSRFGVPLFAALISAAAVAGVAALVLWPLIHRATGDYVLIGTLALGEIVRLIITNATPLTGGALGFVGIERPIYLHSGVDILGLAAGLLTMILWLSWRVQKSAYGKALFMIRDDKLATLCFGRNATALQMQAALLAGGVAGVAGGLFALLQRYLSPSAFGVDENILILAIVLIGGGTVIGPVIGAATLILLPELLRFVGLTATVAGPLRLLLFGAALVFLGTRRHLLANGLVSHGSQPQ